MITSELEHFHLENFEGPLDLLWHLIHRQEIDIYEISVLEVVNQYIATTQTLRQRQMVSIDRGAEFINLTTALLWLKSKTLLPKHEQVDEIQSEEDKDQDFSIIHHLIDYCRFKNVAKELAEREKQQESFYSRGTDEAAPKKNLGIDHLSLEDLASLFQEILKKSAPKKETIHEEEWKVSDKIRSLQSLLDQCKSIPFIEVFLSLMSKQELIVTFLALLELMKLGRARVINDRQKKMICITC